MLGDNCFNFLDNLMFDGQVFKDCLDDHIAVFETVVAQGRDQVGGVAVTLKAVAKSSVKKHI